MNSNERQWTRRSFLTAGISAVTAAVLPIPAAGRSHGESFVHRTSFAMGTMVSIQAYGPDRALLMHAIDDAFSLLHRYDRTFSIFDPDSQVSRINRSAGRSPVHVEPVVIDLLKRAVAASHATEGAFDCTIEPLMRLWGFYGTNPDRWPADSEVRTVLENVGSHHLHIDDSEGTVALECEHGSIDLGGIAVGYTVDAMAALLRRRGVTSALIDHSGDLFAIGTPPSSDGWKVGIRSGPPDTEPITTLSLKDQALSTSNNSLRSMVIEDRTIGHLLDGRTGHPAHSVKSVSVVSDMSIASDILSTAYFVQPKSHFKSDNFGTILDVIIIDHDDSQQHSK